MSRKEPGFRQRHVHLDFHTSPHILDVAAEFDPGAFARTFKEAHVDAVNIFAKCHHGMCYWPVKTGVQHPALKGRDLLGEQIQALHREGIKCPIYYTVGWEEEAAHSHPEWRQAALDGTNPRAGSHPGAWWFMNFLHPEYLEYMETQVREILRYDVDGFWFDIVFFPADACWSEASVKFRKAKGLMAGDSLTQVRFQTAAKEAFAKRFSRLVHSARPEATVFYNGTNETFTDGKLGCRAVGIHETHFEIESLPSGAWGYYHFPRTARTFWRWGKPWVGMTGRFQRSWGDFGGIKPQAALEYECFRTQALGGVNSVGDQLPPRGRLEPAAYRLIGAVYEQCRQAESFYAGSEAIPQIAILNPNSGRISAWDGDTAIEGAVQICEESHYDAAVVDDADDLAGFDLVILPDSVEMSLALSKKLETFREAGGRLLISCRSGFSPAGDWEMPSIPLSFEGEAAMWPNYWRARPEFSSEHGGNDRVCYERGMNVRGGRPLVDRILPYFQRSEERFSSHAQTPPVSDAGPYAAVVEGDRFIYIADPVFREYRKTGNLAARDFARISMERLIGPPPFGAGLPTTVLSVPRRRGADLILTLLHYVPVRKALEVDVIEERMSFAGLILRLPRAVRRVLIFGTNEELKRSENDGWVLPAESGRLLLEVPGFFSEAGSE